MRKLPNSICRQKPCIIALALCTVQTTQLLAQDAPRARPVEEEGIPATPAEPTAPARPVPVEIPPRASPKPATPAPVVRPATPTPDAQVPRTAEDELFEFANKIYEKKSWDAAATRYSKYIEAYPKGKHLDAVNFRQGECHAQMGRLEAAEECYKTLLKRTKVGKFAGYAAFRLATFAYNRGKNDPKYYLEAAPLFGLAAENAQKKEEKVQYFYFQGLSLLTIDKPNEARTAFNELIKIDPKIAGNLYVEKATLGLARMELDAGNKESAKTKFLALAKDATSPSVKAEALVSSGMIDLDAGNHDVAIEALESARKIKGADKWPSMAGYGLVRAYYHKEDWKKIPTAWSGVDLDQIPEVHRAQILLIVGHAYRHLEQFNPAITHYGMVEEYFPNSIEAMEAGYRKLFCFYKLGDPRTDAAAENFIDKQKEKHPDSEYIDMAALMWAEDNFNKKKYKEAARAYRQIRLDKLPEKSMASMIYRRGWAEYESADFPACIESMGYFLDKFSSDPLAPQATFKRALAYMQAKDLANCEKDLETVVSKFPESKEAELAIRQLGFVRGERKDYPGMVKAFEELLVKYPDTKYKGECQFWIGTGLYSQQLWKECVTPLEQALVSYPKEKEDITNKLINAYASLQNVPKLAALVDEHYKTPPKMKVRTDVLSWLGHQKYSEKDYASAAKYLGLAFSNEDAKSQKPYIWLCLAESQVETKDWSGALRASDFFLENAPTDTAPERRAKGFYLKGRACSGLKKYDEAKKLFSTTLDTAPEGKLSAFSRIELGKIAYWEGEFADAGSLFSVPALYFDDPEITPTAIKWAIAAHEKAGNKGEAAKYRKDLKSKYPREFEDLDNGKVSFKAP